MLKIRPLPFILMLVVLCLTGLATHPVGAAPSICENFIANDKIRCEKGERDFPEWRQLHEETCEFVVQKSLPWMDRFAQICYRAFVDLLPGYTHPKRWLVQRDRYFRYLTIVTIPLTTINGQELPLSISARLQAWSEKRIEESDSGSSDKSLDPQQVRIRSNWYGTAVDLLTPSLASISYFEWHYSEGMAGGMTGGMHVHSYELFDIEANRAVKQFAELFTRPDEVLDIVTAIIRKQIAERNSGVLASANLLRDVSDLKIWHFEPEKFLVIFNDDDFGSYMMLHDSIPYSAILPYIKKDGPLGRALGLK